MAEIYGNESDTSSTSPGLTDKQIEVLDLLLEHKTSKEIARELKISPFTVDQRIQFARKKLGAGSRAELAVEYRRQKEAYVRTVYEGSYVAEPAISLKIMHGDVADYLISTPRSDRLLDQSEAKQKLDFRAAPEWFEGRFGTLARIGVIIGFAFFLVLLGLGGLAIFSTLSELLAS